ncbi:MAG: 30S ribosomal protein S3 [Firmicutes bacterium]|nr:30S ribosomal protein S3 [Bacillota bacterium]
MGQKVNPIGLRVGIIKDWESKWFADKKDFANFLHEDHKIRNHIFNKYGNHSSSNYCGISQVIIERAATRLTVSIHTFKPGLLIGKGGAGIEALKRELKRIVKTNKQIFINVIEVKRPDLDAKLLAERVALQLEKRGSFRRAMRSAIQSAMRAGAKGVKTMVSGRLDGAEIARSEHYLEGSIPLHTLRADIDYAIAEARTAFGQVGVKVWIYKGDIIGNETSKEKQKITL